MAGSSEILMAAAWDALDISRPVGANADILLKRLGPGIQMAIFDQQALERGRYVRRKATRQVTRRLEGQAGLDSLAALVVLLREAHEAGNQGLAFELGRSLHASLFLATIEGPLWEIAEELFAYFICFIFPLAEDKELAFDLHPKDHAEAGFLLLPRRTAARGRWMGWLSPGRAYPAAASVADD
ncbi:hypothetical protein ACFQS6_17545 [Xanthomonas populi]|uniref:hypothetical protein n=1 Tax=Xanthomonas populi TaxID=53414 RepID=UPI001FC8ECC7|nr:hypothetical protein [Xanthomonas populi]